LGRKQPQQYKKEGRRENGWGEIWNFNGLEKRLPRDSKQAVDKFEGEKNKTACGMFF
jgi:hypothetical protein